MINTLNRTLKDLRTLFPSLVTQLSKRSYLTVSQMKDHFVFKKEKTYCSELSFVWLRDHCRDTKMYSEITNQRLTHILELKDNVEPLHFSTDENSIRIQWNDGHSSKFDFDWLVENSYNSILTKNVKKRKIEPILWTRSNFPEFSSSVPFDSYMSEERVLKEAVRLILSHGYVIVTHVPPSTKEGTIPTVERISRLADTIYGKSFEFTATQPEAVSDTAFTEMGLSVHTDMTYFSEAAGLQVFHVLQPSTSGGETLLADGFELARQFKDLSPSGYEFLSKVPFESEYKHNSQSLSSDHYLNDDVVFKHSQGHLTQIRFNVYDRAPLRNFDLESQKAFYTHYKAFASLTERPQNLATLKLTPGSVILIDNFRILHGRNGFIGGGVRIMSGCYVERRDFMSRATALKLL